MEKTTNAGDYPYTIEVLKRTSGAADTHGHKQNTWTKIGMAAARRWQTSNSERSNAPLETASSSVRLLCRAVTIDTNQRVRFEGKLYKVTASELRDRWDSLITIEPTA